MTFVATPAQNYNFDRWQLNEIIVSYDSTWTLETESEIDAGTYMAYFTRDTVSVNATVSPLGAGTATGGGDAIGIGDTVTLVATENPGFEFRAWTHGGTVVSTQSTYSFQYENASQAGTYIAVFARVY